MLFPQPQSSQTGTVLQGSCTGSQCGQWTFVCSHACPGSPAHAPPPSAPVMPGYPRDEHVYKQHDVAAGRV